jgi:hypothetical protein
MSASPGGRANYSGATQRYKRSKAYRQLSLLNVHLIKTRAQLWIAATLGDLLAHEDWCAASSQLWNRGRSDPLIVHALLEECPNGTET